MVTQWGMSTELGPIRYSDDEQHVFLGNEITKSKLHSDRMAEQIDHEIRTLLMGCYEKAQSLCKEHADALQRIAEALLELETLTGEDVNRLFEGATAAELVAEREQEEAQKPAPDAEVPERRRDEGPEPGGLPRPASSPA
jgi:cell division protease FtsH